MHVTLLKILFMETGPPKHLFRVVPAETPESAWLTLLLEPPLGYAENLPPLWTPMTLYELVTLFVSIM